MQFGWVIIPLLTPTLRLQQPFVRAIQSIFLVIVAFSPVYTQLPDIIIMMLLPIASSPIQ